MRGGRTREGALDALAVEASRQARVLAAALIDGRARSRGGAVGAWWATLAAARPEATPEALADDAGQALACALVLARWRGGAARRRRLGEGLDWGDATLRGLGAVLAEAPSGAGLGRALDGAAAALGGDAVRAALDAPGRGARLGFFERFLAAHDPARRRARGVYYTPPEVTGYIARRLDEALRQRLGLAEGLGDEAPWSALLADGRVERLPAGVVAEAPFIELLDPALGSGAFLVALIEQAHAGSVARWRAQGASAEEAAARWRARARGLAPRLWGVEVMQPPLVVAHLEVARALARTGAPLEAGARLSLRLGDALAAPGAGEAGAGAPARPRAPTVIATNPPYANRGPGAGPWMRGLLEDYKAGLREQKLNLDDDAIQFMRLIQWYLEGAGCGVAGMITSNTFLDGLTHRRMRRVLLEGLSAIEVLDLGGSARRGDRTADGGRDENVFAIQQGVAIVTLLADGRRAGEATLAHAALRGTARDKRAALAADRAPAPRALPTAAPLTLFAPRRGACAAAWAGWWPVDAVFACGQSGIKTDRDALFIDLDRGALEARMRTLFEGGDAAFRARYRVRDTSSYPLLRRLAAARFDATHLRRCLRRPFDRRWIYYDPALISRPARGVMAHLVGGATAALITCRQQSQPGVWRLVGCADGLVEGTAISSRTREALNYVFPLHQVGQDGGLDPNLASGWRDALCARLGRALAPSDAGRAVAARLADVRADGAPSAEGVLGYALALLHAPSYRTRHAAGLREGFPRLPLPPDGALFGALAALGARAARLHLDPGAAREGEGRARRARLRCAGPVTLDATPRLRDGVVRVGAGCVVEGVDEATWRAAVGAFRPAQTWLRERRGLTLSPAALEALPAILDATAQLEALGEAIDACIEHHGGWARIDAVEPAPPP